MILRQATIKYKGYDPNELKPKSHKRICCTCDGCDRVRWIGFYQYKDLCAGCCKIGLKRSEETCKFISDNHADFKGELNPMFEKHHSNKSKKKISKMLEGKKFTVEHKEKIREKLTGLERSDEQKENYRNCKLGNKNPNYNPNLTNKDRIDRRCVKGYSEWREEVFKKDNFICRQCGTNKRLQAHHIYMWAKYPELRFNIENGITLCKDCHKQVRGYEDKYIDMFEMMVN